MVDSSKDGAREAVHSVKRPCAATVDTAAAIGGKVKKCHCGRVGAICGTGATGVGGGGEWHELVRTSTLYINVTKVMLLVMHAKKLGVGKASSVQGRGKAVFGTLAGPNSAHGIALYLLNGLNDAARQAVHSFKHPCATTVDGAHASGGEVKKCHCGWVGAICGTGATEVVDKRDWHQCVRNITRYVNVTNVMWLVMHTKKLGVVKRQN
uniref:Uncharacterized protein n=1 Tax=Globodera rostochiensis TaxID=31243 RepID=A0A914ICN9_GLORO